MLYYCRVDKKALKETELQRLAFLGLVVAAEIISKKALQVPVVANKRKELLINRHYVPFYSVPIVKLNARNKSVGLGFRNLTVRLMSKVEVVTPCLAYLVVYNTTHNLRNTLVINRLALHNLQNLS